MDSCACEAENGDLDSCIIFLPREENNALVLTVSSSTVVKRRSRRVFKHSDVDITRQKEDKTTVTGKAKQ